MASSEELVTRAYRMLLGLDLYEAAPEPPMMSEGLAFLAGMIEMWAVQGSLNVGDQSLTGTTENASAVVTRFASTGRLAVGMNVSGTGIPADTRILSIDSRTRITLDRDATASGEVTLSFVVLPFPAAYDLGISALLAQQLALLIGEDAIPVMVNKLAADGWAALQANYAPVPDAGFDMGLVNTTTTRRVADLGSSTN